MAIPRTHFGMVDSLAARVTKPAVLSFPGFMRLLGVLLFLPISLLLVAANSPGPSASPSPTTEASPSPSTSPPPSPSPSASPSPSPIPVNAFLSLDVTAGGPTTQITVNGGAFLPNEQMTLYWDQATKIAGGANADGSGNFVTHVKPFSGDGPGAHKLCASVQPNPCATFTLDATPASPSPSPSPSESPSPSASPEVGTTFTPSPSPVAATLNGIDVITSPPFVFLPIAGGLAILLSVGYWLVSVMRRPRIAPLPAAAVVHRATRPDYAAGFGTPPPTPAAESHESSAWNEPMPHTQALPTAPPPVPAPEPPAASEPATPPAADGTDYSPVEWGPGGGGWGYAEPTPPDESPETPQPGD